MGIFSKNEVAVVSVVSASSLKQQSVNALDTFQKVLQDLRGISEASSKRQAELDSEASRIALEIKELESINTDNEKVIKNIEKLLS
jgi:TolA-binding protein